MRLWLYLINAVLIFHGTSWAVAPVVTHIFPAGGQIGKTVDATLSGTFPEWPPKITVNSSDIKIEFKDKNKISIKIEPNATPGPKIFRIFNKDGTSAPKAFWVGTVPELEEVEPNNTYLKPQNVGAGPVLINGKLGIAGDTDSFAVDTKKGQTIIAQLMGNQGIESPMDAAMQILSPDGFILAENHDRHGLDPFISFTAPSDGAYRVRIFAFPSVPDTSIRFSGADTYIYRLTITTGPYLDHVLPLSLQAGKSQNLKLRGWNLSKDLDQVTLRGQDDLSPVRVFKSGIAGNISVSSTPYPSLVYLKSKQNMSVESSCVISGCLDVDKNDSFDLKFKKGEKYKVKVDARSIGSDLDPLIVQVDSSGKEIKRVDDEGTSSRDASLEITSNGEPMILKISDLHNHHGDTYYYRLTFSLIVQDFDFSVDGDIFSPKDKKPVEVPIKISRVLGHSADIMFKAIDLPKGWSAEELTVTSKSPIPVKLVLKPDDKAESGFFKIIGKSGTVSKTGFRNFPSLESTLDDYFLLTEYKEMKDTKKKK
ncbi:MAG: PPC domain-containing protein [Gemmataceae bacterium]